MEGLDAVSSDTVAAIASRKCAGEYGENSRAQEFWQFLMAEKCWLLPIVIVFVLFGLLIVFSPVERRRTVHLHVVHSCRPHPRNLRVPRLGGVLSKTAASWRLREGLHPEEATRTFQRRSVLPPADSLSRAQIDYVGFTAARQVRTAARDYGLGTARLEIVSDGDAVVAQQLWLSGDIHGDHLQAVKPGVVRRHHESHAASAFYPSPFEAAVLTIDGVGGGRLSIGLGRGNSLEIGSNVFAFAGTFVFGVHVFRQFKVSSGDTKVMGLAPCGGHVREDRGDHLVGFATTAACG
jgi:hypothetical protein